MTFQCSQNSLPPTSSYWSILERAFYKEREGNSPPLPKRRHTRAQTMRGSPRGKKSAAACRHSPHCPTTGKTESNHRRWKNWCRAQEKTTANRTGSHMLRYGKSVRWNSSSSIKRAPLILSKLTPTTAKSPGLIITLVIVLAANQRTTKSPGVRQFARPCKDFVYLLSNILFPKHFETPTFEIAPLYGGPRGP